ncbi:MAG: GNAT family N-acetyltransferase [Solirubrobacteraceae bacterium]
MEIRPMRQDDVEPLVDVCADALWGPVEPVNRPRQAERIAYLLRSDPGGAWVADHDGAPVGCALALLREDVWGLSLFALSEAHRTRGTGRRLLNAALEYGAGSRGGIILSSEHPAAMRLYARAGFDLRPCVSLTGVVRNPPAAPAGVRDVAAADLAWMDDVARAVRGAAYGPDLRWWMDDGTRARCVADRGWLVGRGPKVAALLARDEDAAGMLLADHLAAVAPGESVELLFVSAGQDWAVQAGLEAGLALTPDGPVFTRGALGSLRAWIPSGAFL